MFFLYFQNLSKTGNIETGGGNGQQWGGQRGGGSPSHPSQTPSPAGSVGSEGSQSSGYTTSTEGRSKASNAAPPVGHTPPHPQPPQGAHASVSVVSVPVNIHTLIIKQNYLCSYLASAHDMWMEADEYVSKNNIKGEEMMHSWCICDCFGASVLLYCILGTTFFWKQIVICYPKEISISKSS